jgi:aminoglycoside 6'-N-acetyltransferase I
VPQFRIAVASDIPGWTALRHELWPDCPAERHALEIAQLLKGDGIVAVAVEGGSLVGFAEISIRRDHVEGTCSSPAPYLEGWYVRLSHRGQGIGRALLDFVERWSIDRGFEEIASDAELDNQRSIRLHTKLGFVEVGRTVHFVKPLPSKTA